MVGVPPSSSVAVVEHSISFLLWALDGLMVTVPITGSVFSTVALAVSVPVPLPPSESYAVAVQVMTSPGLSVTLMV